MLIQQLPSRFINHKQKKQTESMKKNFNFYRCYLERGLSGEEEPGLFAATEVVHAVCDAGFHRNGLLMKDYPSSPHCYYKYAKTPKEGMYMLRAVKKADMTTLDILIDTRLYPCFVMIEKHTDWQEETEEVKDTLEQVINDDAVKFNWRVRVMEYKANATQYLEEFISALSYINDQEDVTEKNKSTVQIGQLILKVNGNNYYKEEMCKDEPADASEESQPMDHDLLQELRPLFYNNEEHVRQFLREIDGMPPNDITDLVNRWVKDKLISDYGNSRKGILWEILNGAGLYRKSRQNWNRRVY